MSTREQHRRRAVDPSVVPSKHPDQVSLYDEDFYAWLAHNVRMLREGRMSAIDAVNIAEELEDMGRSQKRALASHARILLTDLLKWRHQQTQRSPSWRLSIRNARDQIEALVADSPSLARELPEIVARAYQKARQYAADETGLPLESFPDELTFSLPEVLDGDYLPD